MNPTVFPESLRYPGVGDLAVEETDIHKPEQEEQTKYQAAIGKGVWRVQKAFSGTGCHL